MMGPLRYFGTHERHHPVTVPGPQKKQKRQSSASIFAYNIQLSYLDVCSPT